MEISNTSLSRRLLLILLTVIATLFISGCRGTESNPEYLTLDCIENQLILMRDGCMGEKIFITYRADLPFPDFLRNNLVFSCRKEGDNIIVLNKTVIPFSTSKTIQPK